MVFIIDILLEMRGMVGGRRRSVMGVKAGR